MLPYVEIVPEPADCPYELLHKIGSGGCADVYSAVHPDRPFDPVAVKVPKSGPIMQERFRREIDALRRFDHVHVMPLIEASGRDEWYAMPLADTTLRKLHAADPGAWETLRVALSSTCGALMHAHAHEIVHRDLSPDNLLAKHGSHGLHWLLSDFGLARMPAATSITPTGAAFGAPDFAAPEVRHDPRRARPASDVYSLGALARWFTNIRLGQKELSERGRFWAELIDGTMAYEPDLRWSLWQVAQHLMNPPLERVSPGAAMVPACARCGSNSGIDATNRCLRCGFLDEL